MDTNKSLNSVDDVMDGSSSTNFDERSTNKLGGNMHHMKAVDNDMHGCQSNTDKVPPNYSKSYHLSSL